MSFGFLGIQFGFALQNSNASGILRNYGADVEHLSWFWLAAPVVGLIVQPLVGHYSDRTWNRLGRRRPYFLTGAILSSSALILMPNAGILGAIAPLVIIGAAFLMIMDACFNLAMEPFRALVGDNLPDSQRTLGFSVQTFLIGVGAVIGSFLPYILHNWFGISNICRTTSGISIGHSSDKSFRCAQPVVARAIPKNPKRYKSFIGFSGGSFQAARGEFVCHFNRHAFVQFVDQEQNRADGEQNAHRDAGQRVVAGHGFGRGRKFRVVIEQARHEPEERR